MILPAARRRSSRFLVVVFVLLSLPNDSRGDPRKICRSSSSSFDIGKRLESRLPTKSKVTHMVSTRNQSFSSPLVATTQTTAYRGGMSAQQFGSTNTKSNLGVSFLPNDSSGSNTSFNSQFILSLLQGPLGMWGGYLSYKFASSFPYLLTPRAAKLTYIRAYWKYDIGSANHVFCDSPWTYMTDYGVLLALLIGIYNISKDRVAASGTSSTPPIETATSSIRLRSLLLLVTYSVQFLGGGIAHGFLSTQTKIFRVLWTVVVSNVALSGAVIGSLATALLRRIQLDQGGGSTAARNKSFEHILPNDTFWIGYGIFMVACTIRGNLSYQRPAVDTFVAGTSQAMPTFYLMGVVLYRWWILRQEPEQQQQDQQQQVQMDEAQTMEQQQTFEQQNFEAPQPPSPITSASTTRTMMRIPTETCLMVQLGFVLNAVLLPSYALAVQYTSLSTPTINVLLHSWLCMCYTIQGMVLRKLIALSGGLDR